MTADLEAVTRDKLARWLLDFRYEGRVGWEELGDETHELLRGKADQVAAVLASLPDDRLAEAEAKVSADEPCAEFGSHPRGRHHDEELSRYQQESEWWDKRNAERDRGTA